MESALKEEFLGKKINKIAEELGFNVRHVTETVKLLDEGATVPFITRYRKEMTGTMDEVGVTAVRDRLRQLRELEERLEAMLSSLEERGLLTDELKLKLTSAETMTELEDIYLPFRPKRRTRAMIAKEKGLEPLALTIFAQGVEDPDTEAAKFINPELGVNDTEEALEGARDIIAEWISENQEAREMLRELFVKKAALRSKVASGKEDDGAKYRDYFDWEEPVSSMPSHRILAIRRGENENFLRLKISAPEDEAFFILGKLFVKGAGKNQEQVKLAMGDSYKRLIAPSMETEMRMNTKVFADIEAINVFAENIRQLLLAPPLGQKNILSLDPGFRTGCKVACMNKQGKLLYNTVIYPHPPEENRERSSNILHELCGRFDIEVIAIGNGTAGRETVDFVNSIGLPDHINVIMVNESGASIYSTSDAAREEFPELDATVRSAVSIGRRLMDPLAELVKIEPKSIGVGQYQHDVDQGLLKDRLDDVVVSCVNSVGVDVNTASKQLLTYVSGVGPSLAKRIVEFRDTNGPFRNRAELRKVPKLGEKAFEQSAGFLRIRSGDNPLDSSAVHPESYRIVGKMASDVGCSVIELMEKKECRDKIDIKKYVDDKVGIPTLTDIVEELEKPGRDPRTQFEQVTFSESVREVGDLKPGMRLPGIVTNITAFGAFVDIGVHRDGLVHISHLADKFVKNPADVVKVHQKVMATVLEVDIARGRISLSLKTNLVEN